MSKLNKLLLEINNAKYDSSVRKAKAELIAYEMGTFRQPEHSPLRKVFRELINVPVCMVIEEWEGGFASENVGHGASGASAAITIEGVYVGIIQHSPYSDTRGRISFHIGGGQYPLEMSRHKTRKGAYKAALNYFKDYGNVSSTFPE